jgi:hypothetical protein
VTFVEFGDLEANEFLQFAVEESVETGRNIETVEGVAQFRMESHGLEDSRIKIRTRFLETFESVTEFSIELFTWD